ncbi:unnamed protein product [Rotaria sordida]|uniref:Gcp-like domain-containing protein n=1 Tax=Rotaria sordida TaxID=392033 RepID=A0A819ZBG8_9BILA|nr:unnamed protein product [Rotaria sordida]CAF0912666.1 unnamed protein product [Rotaria sordida]CAF0914726.1 unnamed protein product [Rotaria sordida]CAF3925763.1 unnamed protein product [Rotaria sordida]CAF4161275.1 unnamed protein product [Rotaria sordida]
MKDCSFSFGSMLSQIQRVIGNENISCVPVGGAASNLYLRQRMNDLCSHYGIELVCPSVEFCTDNDGMIA